MERWQQVRDWVVQHTQASEWTTFFTVLGCGLVVVVTLRWWLLRWIGNILGDSKVLRPDTVRQVINWPLPALVLFYFLRIALDAFKQMPPWLWMWKQQAIPVVCTLVVIVLGWRCIDVVARVALRQFLDEDDTLQDNLLTLLTRAVKMLFATLVLLLILQNFGVEILPLLTGLGFLGAAVALAAQSTIGNAIGGVEILVDRLFNVGHRIRFGDYDGFVVERGLRSVVLKSITGEIINVPNKDLVDKQIRNYTREVVRGGRRLRIHQLRIEVGLLYDCGREQIGRALGILEDVAAKHENVHDQEAVFRGFGESALNLELILWADYQNEHDLNRLLTQLNTTLKERFDEAGLGFAFPTQTVHLAGRPSGS
ncbi:MAG: mechanosensitive ion channel family protein [Candidatus Methylacidiphilales bacterium]|nr:mechanosensitive ion channel family protein [Candidatus Methylacidiphilales bacterium]